MNANDRDKNRENEERLQLRAEQYAAEAGDADTDAYRLVYRTVREAPLPEPPHDFAARMESITRDVEEQAAAEKWIVRAGLATAGVMLLVTGSIVGQAIAGRLASSWTAAPVSLLFAAGVGMLLVGVVDYLRGRAGDSA